MSRGDWVLAALAGILYFSDSPPSAENRQEAHIQPKAGHLGQQSNGATYTTISGIVVHEETMRESEQFLGNPIPTDHCLAILHEKDSVLACCGDERSSLYLKIIYDIGHTIRNIHCPHKSQGDKKNCILEPKKDVFYPLYCRPVE
jgi:hypothetical protein